MNGDARFPKDLRIVRGDDFTRVLRRGGCAADGMIVVFVLPRSIDASDSSSTGSPATRLGVTIPKKTGNAVARNQWKRHIRESFRTQKDRFPAGWDIVVRPKKDAKLDAETIRKGLPKVVARAIKRT